MSQELSLTIGIPTYKRKEQILSRVQEHLDSPYCNKIQLLVIDNHSPDGTYEELVERFEEKSVKLYKQRENVGFALNLISLFEKCPTKYLLILSDEDKVDYSPMDEFLCFLNDHKPYVVSPIALIDGKDYRGVREDRLIRPEEFRLVSNYMSGVTYNVPALKDAIPSLKKWVHEKSQAAMLYPQVLLSTYLMTMGPCYWYGKGLTMKTAQLESHMNRDNGTYYFLNARWEEFKAFLHFFDNFKFQGQSAEAIVDEMRSSHLKSLKKMLTRSIISECTDYKPVLKAEFSNWLDLNTLSPVKKRLINYIRRPPNPVRALMNKFRG